MIYLLSPNFMATDNRTEDALQNGARRRWAARNGDINRQYVGNPATTGIVLTKESAVTRASAHCDYQFGLWHGVIGALQGSHHVARHRPGHQQHVGMSWAGHKLDTQTLDVVIRIAQGIELELTTVARTGINHTNAQGAAQNIKQLTSNAIRVAAQGVAGCGRRFSANSATNNLLNNLPHQRSCPA